MSTVITAGNDTNNFGMVGDGSGILELKTGGGAGTTALTLSSSQKAILACTSFSTVANGALEYNGTAFYGTPLLNERGVLPTMEYYRLNANSSGANVAAMGIGFITGGSGTTSNIAGTTLTVGGTVANGFAVGQQVYGTGITANTIITALGTGTGGSGTYTVSISQTVGSREIKSSKGLTVSSNTVYAFEMVYGIARTVGTSTHNFSLLFGGTASVHNIMYNVKTTSSSTNSNTTPAAVGNIADFTVTTAGAQALFTGFTTTIYMNILIKGTVAINAGGTFIPQYQLSAAPGGTYITLGGSYMQFYPIGPYAAADISVGNWV